MDGQARFRLQPLADYVLEKIKQGERIFAGETNFPTLAPGTGKTQKAWLWAYARDGWPFGGNGPPMAAYCFEDSRGGGRTRATIVTLLQTAKMDSPTDRSGLADLSDRCSHALDLRKRVGHPT
jgi:hypothetical protein